MNDTKEFNKWWKENMPNPDWLSSEHSTDACKAWEAACEYKNQEIETLKQKIEKMKQCLEFYADKDSYIEQNGMMAKYFTDLEDTDYEEIPEKTKNGRNIFVAGKRARNLLKEMENHL